jgi:HSP20 family protein
MALPTRMVRTAGDPFEVMHREFDSMLNRLFTGEGNGGQRWAPYAVDVREDPDHIYVDAEMPGFNKDDIELTLENQTF